MKRSVLFVCIHNSARSQMAEAFLKALNKDLDVESAGIEPGRLNPLVVRVMQEIGIDISNNRAKSVQSFLDKGRSFDFVITVCDDVSAERCPVFPGKTKRLHWPFDDPSAIDGSEEEKLEKIRIIRDEIRSKVEDWVKQGFI